MNLVDLDPHFLKSIDERSRQEIDDISKADGIMFLCPKCFIANNGPVRTHVVVCWTPGVPPEITPGPGRWEMLGTGYHDLSLRAGSSSVLLQGGCNAHFFVENGKVRMV